MKCSDNLHDIVKLYFFQRKKTVILMDNRLLFTNLTNDLCQHFTKCYLLKQSSTKIYILVNKNNTHYKNPPIR